MEKMLKNILAIFALVLLLTACSKETELYTPDGVKIERAASADDVDNNEGDPGVNSGSSSGDESDDQNGINDDDDNEDDDEINDDDDDEDDDEANSIKVGDLK
jgi:hypothetical protein